MLLQKKHVSRSTAFNLIRLTIKMLLFAAAVVVQIGLYALLIVFADAAWYMRTIVSVLGLVFVLIVHLRSINMAYKLSWSFLILLFPVIGTVLYFVFGGKRSLPRRKAEAVGAYLALNRLETEILPRLRNENETACKLAMTVFSESQMPLYEHTATKYYDNILEKHNDMLRDIKSAKDFIFMEYFIASDGYVLNTILDALEEKGREGVEIKFMFDDIGSMKRLRGKTKHRIVSIPNLQVCVYEPVGLRLNPRINFRDHRKIVIIDGRIGYIGGDNLADEYINKKIKFGHWRDNAMRIEGMAVDALVLLFAEMWYITADVKLDTGLYIKSHQVENNGYVMPFGDGPANSGDPAYDLFSAMIANADKYMYLSTPYFILDSAFIGQIELAAKSGVDVKILLPHIPDKKLTFKLTRGHYRQILRAGGKIYEYTPGFNHAKNLIVDDRYAFIGTVNCDYRSMFLHYENGALLIDNSDIRLMRDDFLRAIGQSEEITLEKWNKRLLFSKIIEKIFQIAAPMF
ncbi:MAG: cardiolipin synthase [Clostridiales bacterium]|jgi:cardiolipin synthase|nr:cardiolipin synthase [Clostridiales bacterium]